ncbi:MAG TPA: O-antigen ligase domain-containing protein [Flavobacteriia bacterium]|nr:O-antigen ligase domain-containing protein [Flavobacteriia bacterium]
MIENKYYYTFFGFFLFLMGLLPLLPFHQKPIGLVIGLLFGLVFWIKNIKVQFIKQYFLNALPFFIYFIGMVNSKNTTFVFHYLETNLPLVLFPLVFILFSNLTFSKEQQKKWIVFFYQIYIYSAAIFSILIFMYAFYLGYFSNKVSYSYLMSYFVGNFWGFHDHPIYISLILSIAILFQLELFFQYSKKKGLLIISSLFIFSAIIFLSRKGVIIALLLAIIFYIFNIINTKRYKAITVTGLLALMVISFSLLPNSTKRFKELLQTNLYMQKAQINNSTSTRIGIYKCSINLMRNAGILGYGLGDVKSELNNCFKQNDPNLTGHKFNTHNVYFNIILGTGYLGMILFLFYLYKLFNFAKANKDILYLSILLLFVVLFLFENILDRQNGVLLFAFLINFFTFKNRILLDEKEKK